jgi:hypothetical protein
MISTARGIREYDVQKLVHAPLLAMSGPGYMFMGTELHTKKIDKTRKKSQIMHSETSAFSKLCILISLMTLSHLHMLCNVNDYLGRTLKHVVVAYFKILSLNLTKSHDAPSEDSWSPGQELKQQAEYRLHTSHCLGLDLMMWSFRVRVVIY